MKAKEFWFGRAMATGLNNLADPQVSRFFRREKVAIACLTIPPISYHGHGSILTVPTGVIVIIGSRWEGFKHSEFGGHYPITTNAYLLSPTMTHKLLDYQISSFQITVD